MYSYFNNKKFNIFTLLIIISNSYLFSQTVLLPGDMIILGINADRDGVTVISPPNSDCYPGTTIHNTEDCISMMFFKDIVPGTTLDMTDCGYEYTNVGLFGDTEGAWRLTYNGPTIPAGTIIEICNDGIITNFMTNNPLWSAVNINLPNGPGTQVNLNQNGDQIFFMQGGTWNNPTGSNNASYVGGNILYAFSTNTQNWTSFAGSTQQSGLPPGIGCYSQRPLSASNFSYYTGPTTACSQLEWLIRVDDVNNWTSVASCLNYMPLTGSLPILPSTIALSCQSNCQGCAPLTSSIQLTINGLPTVSPYAPYTVTYATPGGSTGTVSNA